MQLTLHANRSTPHGASLLVQQAMSAWSVKTRRAPSRHCRDARVYGHTTTAMQDDEYRTYNTQGNTYTRPNFQGESVNAEGCCVYTKTTIYVVCVPPPIEERDMLEEMKVDECGMEKFGTLDRSKKTIAILGDRWWPQTAKQEGGYIRLQKSM